MKYRSFLAAGIATFLLSSASAADRGVFYRFTGDVDGIRAPATALAFEPRANVLLGGKVVSAPARYTGGAANVVVTDGEMRVCATDDCATGGSWTATVPVTNGAVVQVRRDGPATPGAVVAVRTSVLGLASVFEATGTTDVSIGTFAAATASPGEATDSDLATFRGWTETPVTVTGGEYRLCPAGGSCGSFTAAPGVARHTDQIQLRAVAGPFGETRSVVATAGGASSTFILTTRPVDATPDAYAFGPAATGVEPASENLSATVTLAGFDEAPISIAGEGAQYALNGGAFTAAAGTAKGGDTLRVRVTAGAFGETRTATVSVGSASASFTATVRAKDTTPDAFVFGADVVDAEPKTVVVSTSVTLGGFDDAPITISGTGAEYALNGGTYGTTPATARRGDTLLVRVTVGAGGETRVASVVVGGLPAVTWSVAAKSAPMANFSIHRIGGTGSESGNGAASLANGGMVVVGQTSSPGVAGENDAFLTTYDNTGGIVWRKALGGAANDTATAVASSGNGRIVLTGHTSSPGGAGDSDAFVALYESDGSPVWRRTLGGTGNESSNGVAVLSSGGVAIAGTTSSPNTAGSEDALVATYTASGALSWRRSLGGTGSDAVYGVTALSNGGVAVTGATFSPGGAGSSDAFVATYNASGTFGWRRVLGGTSNDTATGVAALSNGNIAIVGHSSSPGGAGSSDAFVAVYDTSGTVVWRKSFGGSGAEVARGAVALPNGAVAVVGNTTSPGGAGGNDAFVVVYDSTGRSVWRSVFGGSSADFALAASLLSNGDIAMTGYTASPGGSGGNDLLVAAFPSTGPREGVYGHMTVGGMSFGETSTTMATNNVVAMETTRTVTMEVDRIVPMSEPTIPMTQTWDARP